MSDDRRAETPKREGRDTTSPRENASLGFVQQPRILLVLLAAWEIVAVLVELLAVPQLLLTSTTGSTGCSPGGC